MSATKIGTTDMLQPGTGTQLQLGDTAIALLRDEEGNYHALDAMCSHGEVELADGDIYEGKVECWGHGATFDLETGQPSLPAVEPVKVHKITIDGNDLLVEITGK